ncbi:MAG: hypothetical protein HQK79_20245 [Desulfobacterales bacterium]|nr:hypothetical protein [Desulfobacterales bacterium]
MENISYNPYSNGIKIDCRMDLVSKGFSNLQLIDTYYKLTSNKEQERLILETASFDEIDIFYNPFDQVEPDMILEAITIKPFSRTPSRMAALARVFNNALKADNIQALEPEIGKPKKSGMFATVTVQIPFSDGQVISIIFHSPEGSGPTKITAEDEIIAFRWLLNKRDITMAVAPEDGKDVTLDAIGKRIAQLIVKNSAKFQAQQESIKKQKEDFEALKAATEEANKTKESLINDLADLQNQSDQIELEIKNLNDRIAKQKEINDDLQRQIDGLTAKQKGNQGKADVGDTPKDEGEMAKEQEDNEIKNKIKEFEQELLGRNLKLNDTFSGKDRKTGDIRNIKVVLLGNSLPCRIKVEIFDNNDTVIDDNSIEAKTMRSLNSAIKKFLAFIDKYLKDLEPVKQDNSQQHDKPPEAVTIANNILAGKYDEIPKELLKMADKVFELDEKKYIDLMTKVDAYTTAFTKNMVKMKLAA